MNRSYCTHKEGDKYYAVVTLKGGMDYYYGPYPYRQLAYYYSKKFTKTLSHLT